MTDKFTLYFSHSWRPDHVSLNLYVWTLVKDQCNLRIDDSGDNVANPPYIINRIEELLRRSDLFLCVLPYRENNAAGGYGDSKLNCSPYSLFEIRLAERANRPRLIIYDFHTKFQSPVNPPPNARYLPLDFAHSQDFLEPRIKVEIDRWLDWAENNMSPQNTSPSTQSLVFLPEDIPARDQAIKHIEMAFETTYYQKPIEIRESVSNDAELFRTLANGGLLVCEVSDRNKLSVYSVAHALFIPSVRLLYLDAPAVSEVGLPWLLQGHPKGYQEDIVRWKEPAQLAEAVRIHAEAMAKTEKVITKFEDGKKLFEKRRYLDHRVFISHNLPLGQRNLVDLMVQGLKNISIEVFEYAIENRAGEKWRKRLEKELAESTHFVLLLTDGYEQSPACLDEIKHALAHRDTVQFIPFLANGRTRPFVDINETHHLPLLADSESNAATVIRQVERALLRPH